MPSAGGVNLIDRLSTAGLGRLVQGAAGVVCSHSSVNMLASYERIPQLVLYPPHVHDMHFSKRDMHAFCANFFECTHGIWHDYQPWWLDRFLERVRGGPDVRGRLLRLPHVWDVAGGLDLRGCDWFMSPDCYPMYAKAAAAIKPESILEIGTHLGFGLAAFHEGWPLSTLSWVDNEAAIPGSNDLCRRNLGAVETAIGRVTRVGAAREGFYDLVHVDADTSKDGTLVDVSTAWALRPRVVLVDDYLSSAEVRGAVITSVPEVAWR